jgi:small-conductance mechanosensitive channel/CRP-like cAMP-binding protein
VPSTFLHQETSLAILCSLALGLLLLAVRPADRASVRNVLVLLGVLVGVELLSIAADTWFDPDFGRVAAMVAAFGVGTVLIRLGAMLVFRSVLPVLRMAMPRIVEDLVTTGVVIAWLMYWLHDVGVDLASLVTTSAVITAVLAFSMQDTLGNILGGLVLQLDDSVRVGDWVKIDDISGQVVDVRWRHTAVETRNRETVVIPNGWLVKNRFMVIGSRSETKPTWRRWVWLDVDASASPGRVIQLLEDAVNNADIAHVLRDPPPSAVLMEMGARGARYALRYWMNFPRADDPTDSMVRMRLLAALARSGIALAIKREERLHIRADEGERAEAEYARRRHALTGIELFASLSSEELDALAHGLVAAPFLAGDTITRQGAVAHWLYLIVAGDADVWYEDNGLRTHVATLATGSVFGEMGMMTGEPRGATVTAKTDVECFRLDKTAFESIIHSRPDIAGEISTIIVNRRMELDSLRDSAGKLTSASQREVVLARIRSFFGLDTR